MQALDKFLSTFLNELHSKCILYLCTQHHCNIDKII